MKGIFFALTIAGLATASIACNGNKNKGTENRSDTTLLIATKEEPVLIENANIMGTDWTLGMAHNVLYSFKANRMCSIKSLLDTAEEEYRKAMWNLSHDTLSIMERDTSFYKVTELSTVHLSLTSINKPRETEDENYDQATDDYFYLREGSDVRLLRETILFSKKQGKALDSRLLIGYWEYKGYYSMADKSYEFNQDGTYTYIEGPRAEEKYINVKHKGTWSLQDNFIHLKRSSNSGDVSENLALKRITTSHLAFEGKKEIYLRVESMK